MIRAPPSSGHYLVLIVLIFKAFVDLIDSNLNLTFAFDHFHIDKVDAICSDLVHFE
jgi:hypothetical protein